MTAYIATKLENSAAHNRIRDLLKSGGVVLSYDWTAHGSVKGQGEERVRQISLAEKLGVATADVIIVVLPGGRGTHVEMGMALALGKPIVLLDESESAFSDTDKTCAFYHDPRVRWVNSEDEAVLVATQLISDLACMLRY